MNSRLENVLVIDDDSWNHRIVNKYLSRYNINTKSTLTAFEGIAYAINKKPDIIFLDIILPDMKGTYVIKLLKMIDVTKDIPVLILSGNMEPDIIRYTKDFGAVGFISKPYKESIIIEKLKEVFPREVIFDMLQ